MNKYFNPNPNAVNVGDCAVRALCKATDRDWDTVFWGIAVMANMMGNMPSANAVWGAYLRKNGFERKLMDEDMSVREFAKTHPEGVYVLALDGHVCTCRDGEYFDTWDSGDKNVLYYWQKG